MELNSVTWWIAQGAALLVFWTVAFNLVFKTLPGPFVLPLIGNVHLISTPKIHLTMEKWADKYGDLYEFWILTRRVVVTARPGMVRELMKKRPSSFARDQPLIDSIFSLLHGYGLFNGKQRVGEATAINCAELLRKAVEESYDKICAVLLDIFQTWDRALKIKPYIEVDISKSADAFTADVLYKIALFGGGVDAGASQSGLVDDVQKVFQGIGRRAFGGVPVYKVYHNKQEKECEAASKRVREYIYQMVEGVRGEQEDGDSKQQQQGLGEERPALKNDHKDVPNLLAKLAHAKEVSHDNRNGLSSQEVFANAMTILLAGSDTTSTTIAWTLYLLLKNPAVVKTAQQEVDSVFSKDDVPSVEQLSQLKYVNAIIQESLRLKGTATVLPLQCLENSTVIDGVKLKRGEGVYALLRYTSTKNGGGPKFDPSRWLENEQACKASYFPFGYGPRVCPGKELAKIEASLFIALLVRRYHITYTLGQPLDNSEVFMLVMKPEKPVLARIAQR